MAQKIFYNGEIHSLNKACPRPEAIAIRDGKILALGKLIGLKALSHNNTEWINLKGKTVLPAFFDPSSHSWKVGDLLTYNLDLREVNSIEEIQAQLAAFSKANPTNKWLRCSDFNEANFVDSRLPTRQDIDKVVNNRPVFLQRTCSNIATLNSKALEICGIDKNTPEPVGGEIQKDTAGILTGILTGTAVDLVFNHFPTFSEKEYEEMILAAAAMSRLDQKGESLPADTTGSATINKVLDKTGSLTVGKDADMILLEGSPFSVAPEILKDWKPERVWQKGELIVR